MPGAADADGFTLSVVEAVAPELILSDGEANVADQPEGTVAFWVKVVAPHPESLFITATPYVTAVPGPPFCTAGDTDTVGLRRVHEVGTTYVALTEVANAGSETLLTRGTMAYEPGEAVAGAFTLSVVDALAPESTLENPEPNAAVQPEGTETF